ASSPPPWHPPSTCCCRSGGNREEKPGPLRGPGNSEHRKVSWLPCRWHPAHGRPALLPLMELYPDLVAPALAGTRPGILPCVSALSPDACHPATFPTGRPATPASIRLGRSDATAITLAAHDLRCQSENADKNAETVC